MTKGKLKYAKTFGFASDPESAFFHSPVLPPSVMAWRKIKAVGKLAGVDVHPHMLRHTFATELLKRGENIVTIGKIMGHESLDTTRKYTKLADIAMVKPEGALSTKNRANSRGFKPPVGRG